jgi:ribonuclease HI
VIHVDGLSTEKSGGAGVMLKAPGGEQLCNSLRLEFIITNNEAKYKVVLAGLKLAQEMGAEYVEVQSDSQVIVGHIRGEYKTKGEKMKLYLSWVQEMQTFFKEFSIVKIPRQQSEGADLLAHIGFTTPEDTDEKTDIPIQTPTQPTIAKNTTIFTLEVVPLWAEELVNYLQEDILPTNKKVVVKLKARVAQFT